ncbi:hypothetical protein FOTG_17891 [Fusarium oxysporum f. sp. vasinfectum 25433]|uniref:Uncharacterized protein n=1 Tax=Fusarium oxysporum f. sp. vasinfectum 25433 TaxID=1089449 RepID=X0KY15_FUSOX|nr:hypothetical protein FOTG_17891 [Fusarium oxysporum f. sp. vasinfectum 25433]
MSLWSCSFEALICSLDDKGIWLTFGGWSMPTGLEYIRDEYHKRQTAEVRAELEQWKALIPLVSSTVDGCMNYQPLAMIKTYNYSICCLYQQDTFVPSVGDYLILLAAAIEKPLLLL